MKSASMLLQTIQDAIAAEIGWSLSSANIRMSDAAPEQVEWFTRGLQQAQSIIASTIGKYLQNTNMPSSQDTRESAQIKECPVCKGVMYLNPYFQMYLCSSRGCNHKMHAISDIDLKLEYQKLAIERDTLVSMLNKLTSLHSNPELSEQIQTEVWDEAETMLNSAEVPGINLLHEIAVLNYKLQYSDSIAMSKVLRLLAELSSGNFYYPEMFTAIKDGELYKIPPDLITGMYQSLLNELRKKVNYDPIAEAEKDVEYWYSQAANAKKELSREKQKNQQINSLLGTQNLAALIELTGKLGFGTKDFKQELQKYLQNYLETSN